MTDTINFELPWGSSAVGVWRQNKLRDGDRVTETEILHEDGTKSPRYVSSSSGLRVKASTLTDLKALEARIHPRLVKCAAEILDLYQKIQNFSQKVVRGRHRGHWYEFVPGKGAHTILWNKNKLRDYNKYLVPLLGELMERQCSISKRKSTLWNLLSSEILREGHKVFGYDNMVPGRLLINGRTYLLCQAGGRVGGLYVVGVVEEFPLHEV